MSKISAASCVPSVIDEPALTVYQGKLRAPSEVNPPLVKRIGTDLANVMDNGNDIVESNFHEHDVGETGNLLVKRDMCYNVRIKMYLWNNVS